MNRMRLTMTCLAAMLLTAVCLSAQDYAAEGESLKDTVIYRQSAVLDTLLAGHDIFSELPSVAKGDGADVRVHQSEGIAALMASHFAGNPLRAIQGYRVRIFFDNRQTARTESEATLRRFSAVHYDIPAYRSYVNPYFKVTVGDFRTKSEAMQLLVRIKDEYPSAFIVKENINFPVVDKSRPVVADTVKVIVAAPAEPAL
ncbi:MAG: SPOR domain-containing protein [Candidatus Cryptobacteroides sp.]